MTQPYVEEEKTEPLDAALDNDDLVKEEPEARPRFARGTSSFYIAARDAYHAAVAAAGDSRPQELVRRMSRHEIPRVMRSFRTAPPPSVVTAPAYAGRPRCPSGAERRSPRPLSPFS